MSIRSRSQEGRPASSGRVDILPGTGQAPSPSFLPEAVDSMRDELSTMEIVSTSDYPHPTTTGVTAVMKANRRRDTLPERRLRSLLFSRGRRYRCDYPIEIHGYRVRADIAFPSKKVAIFVDGCFWHSCDVHGNAPRSNSFYWGPKLARNRERDRSVDRRLTSEGWTVVRIWEHTPPSEAADEVMAVLDDV